MSVELFELTAVAIAFGACVADIRTRKIPNVLTFGAAAAALLAQYIVGGSDGLYSGLLGWFVGCALFFPFFLLGGMGAGDVKLLAALGAWLGAGEVFWLAIYASLAGGVLAVAVGLAHGYLLTAFRNIGSLLLYWWYVGPRPMPTMTISDASTPRLAYALPVFIGTVVALWS